MENPSFGAKPKYQVADCDIAVKDILTSPGIRKYFEVMQMPTNHGKLFRANFESEPVYTLLVVEKETGEVLKGDKLKKFITFATKTIQAERAAAQQAESDANSQAQEPNQE